MNWKQLEKSTRAKDKRQMKNRPCEICGRYKGITQAHHLVPMETLIRLTRQTYEQHGFFPKTGYTLIALCPNHHALLHMLTDRGCLPVNLDAEEKDALVMLANRQAQTTREYIENVLAECDIHAHR